MPALAEICQAHHASSDWKQILWVSIQKLARVLNCSFVKEKKKKKKIDWYLTRNILSLWGTAPFVPLLQHLIHPVLLQRLA